jgi:hypothetical protein
MKSRHLILVAATIAVVLALFAVGRDASPASDNDQGANAQAHTIRPF